MKNLALKLIVLFTILFLASCTAEDIDDNTNIVGLWKLTTWTIDIPVDLNNDNSFSINLLDEISCDNNETLVFDNKNIVSSNDTFNPNINIALMSNEKYVFNVECAVGSIGFATSYSQINNSIIEFNNVEATIIGNKLSWVYENAIKIYNENFTEVVETKDLILIYTKQ
ncbi:MAG TPA: hypothetical protein VKN14_13750 [Flavobacteriaceae bacterium]|nr:hypothetical protein [Flavobacteriaceae bacterium]